MLKRILFKELFDLPKPDGLNANTNQGLAILFFFFFFFFCAFFFIHIHLRWFCLLSSCEFQPSRPDVGSDTSVIIAQKNPILRSLYCLCEFTLSWSVSWGVSCTGLHVLVQCMVPLAHYYRAHPPLSSVPFPTTDSGSRTNPTERLRLTSRFSLDIPPENQSIFAQIPNMRKIFEKIKKFFSYSSIPQKTLFGKIRTVET